MLEGRQAAIRELVRRTYEDPRVVARYAHVGLWPAEEILVLEYVPEQARVLDLGCGAGRTSLALAEMGLEVVGIDLSQAMVQAASQLAQAVQVAVQFQVMDAMELRFPEASFDVALYSYNGLELLPGKEGKRRAMQEVHRVLRRGGHFIFCTHSLFALNRFALLRLQSFLKLCAGRLLGLPVREQELGERFCDEEDEEVKYLQVLPPGTLLRMLRECGFAVRYFNTRRRLERGRAWAWPAAFEDGERFYVARKK